MVIKSVNTTNIVRVEKNNNYTTINNTCLRDDRLSWKAKGIMTYFLQLPDTWVINLEEIITHATDGEKSFRSGLNELKKFGYVERKPIRNDKKVITGYETIIYEVPQTLEPHLIAQNLHVGKLQVGKLHVGNEGLLSTNNINNLKELNTNNIKENVSINDTYPYERIIDYLNRRVGSSFQSTSEETRKLIRGRLQEGASAEDFKTVIDKKWREWHNDPKMVKYLRPKTLFSKTNFSEYLGEAELLPELKRNNNHFQKKTTRELLDSIIDEEENGIEEIRSGNVIQGNGQVLLQSY